MEQPGTAEGPNVIEDKPTNESANENTNYTEKNGNEDESANKNADCTLDDEDTYSSRRSYHECRTVEHLTYDSLGQTHQQSRNEKTLEQCHNIITSDARQHKDIKYNGDKVDIIAHVMMQIQEQA